MEKSQGELRLTTGFEEWLGFKNKTRDYHHTYLGFHLKISFSSSEKIDC